DGDDWPIWGHSVKNERGEVWIVHGDRWDPHNAIERDRLRESVAARRGVDLPVGSKLVYEVAVIEDLPDHARTWDGFQARHARGCALRGRHALRTCGAAPQRPHPAHR